MMLNDSLLEACSQEWRDLESSRLCPSLAHSDLEGGGGYILVTTLYADVDVIDKHCMLLPISSKSFICSNK